MNKLVKLLEESRLDGLSGPCGLNILGGRIRTS